MFLGSRNSVLNGIISKLTYPIFSMYLSSSPTQSEILFGAADQSKYIGDITWIRITLPAPLPVWSIPSRQIKFGSTLIEPNPVHTILDSGSSLIIIPSNAFNLIHDILYNNYHITVQEGGILPCNVTTELPDLIFNFNGKLFGIPSHDYIVPSGNHCVLLFIEEIDGSTWILGDVFLRRVYTIYNVGLAKIGLAPAFIPSEYWNQIYPKNKSHNSSSSSSMSSSYDTSSSDPFLFNHTPTPVLGGVWWDQLNHAYSIRLDHGKLLGWNNYKIGNGFFFSFFSIWCLTFLLF